MATGVIRQGNHRFENLFFSGMAVLILGTVFLGFARSYYLAGVFKAPLPNLIVHIHGAVFSSWILLLIAQTALVAAGRVDLHRRLGLLGFALACLVVILGLLAATDSLGRHFAAGEPGVGAKAFYAIPIADMVVFSTLVYFAFRERLERLGCSYLAALAAGGENYERAECSARDRGHIGNWRGDRQAAIGAWFQSFRNHEETRREQ